MKNFIAIILLFLAVKAVGQELVVDPVTSAAIAVNAGVINSQLNKTNNNLSLISKGQMAVTGQLVIVNDLQNKIYKGLSEVASVIRNLESIKEIAECGSDVISDVGQAISGRVFDLTP